MSQGIDYAESEVNPQWEDGFTKIANEIIEALGRTRLSGEENQIVYVIFRKTFGWGKTWDRISLSQFVELTGLKKPNVIRARRNLLSKKIIDYDLVTQEYRVNKHYDLWKPLSKKITLSKMIIPVIKNDNKPLSKMIPTKETNTKETTKETHVVFFESFWQAYPARKGKKLEKAATFRRYCQLKEADIELINQAVVHYAESDQVKRGIGIRDPKRFIRDGRGSEPWRDWIEPEMVKKSNDDLHGWLERTAVNDLS